MWTRTLSTTISTKSSAMAGLSHGGRSHRAGPPAADRERDQQPRRETTDMGEEGHAAADPRFPEGGETGDQLEHEPEAQDQERRNLDELVEEAEEHERQDPRARIQDHVRPQRRGDRPRGADQRHRGARRDRDVSERRHDPAQQVETEERRPAQAVLDVVPEDPEIEHVADEVQPAGMEEQAGHDAGGTWTGRFAKEVDRNETVVPEEPVQPGLAAAGNDAELPGEGDAAGGDEEERDQRRPARWICVAERDQGAADVREGTGPEPAPPDGWGLPAGSSAICVRTAGRSESRPIQYMVGGPSPSGSGTTYIARTTFQPVWPPARRYCSMNVPVALSRATTR